MQDKGKSLEFNYFRLRLVEVNDAEFILSLRTNPELSKYLSYVDNDLDKQINWIKEYKKREDSKKEYYYIAEDYSGNKYGTIRLYNFKGNEFEHGSWIFKPDSPNMISIRTEIYIREFAFNILGYEIDKLEVRKKNKRVIMYHNLWNLKKNGEDDLNYYYELSKDNFFDGLPKVKKIFSIND